MISRREVLKAGFIVGAGTMASSENIFSSPKTSGEIRVLFLVGDYWHNGMAQESHWRNVLGPTGWKLLFAQSSQFVTPQTLKQADLLVVARYSGPDSIGWSSEGIVEDRPTPAPFMTEEQETAIIDNVQRGMGLLAMHCTVWNNDRKKFLNLIGIKESAMHGPVQYVKIHDINQTHPITKGITEFDIELDENFGANVDEKRVTVLYKSTGMQDGRVDNAAWCCEAGNGRIVALLAGHTQNPFHKGQFKEIMWRSAHWALKRDLPQTEFHDGY